jgi:hypothetical protein
LSENSFSQLVNEPTRYRTCQNPSLLDLILTTDENLVTSVKVSSPIGISDHSTIKFDLQLLLYPDKKYKEYNYIKTDFENLNNELSPWIDDSLLNKVKYKKKLWKKNKQTLSNTHLLEHRRFSNQLKAEIGRAKSKYEHSLIDKPKAFYSYVRKRIAGRVSVPVVRGVDGLLCSNFVETADTLAGSFALSFSIPALISTVLVVTTWNGSKLSHVDFDPGIVEEHLLQLSVDTAPGPDQTMSAKLLKNCAISLSTPLSEIMTSSFAAGVLPKEWLLATVTPLYKSGDKLDPVNYRPVSLTSISCKVMEEIIVKQLLAHMEDNNLIPEQQHGFIPGRSVVTGLLFSTNTWTKTMDSKQPLDIIYLDFSKAFDKVPHDLLLKKLKSRGINGCLLRWIGAFLANRTFCVRVGKVTSSLRSVVSGVPQGSVLGPILFLLYTCDLLRSIENCYSAYADDIKIFGDPQKTDLQAKLNIVTEWSKKMADSSKYVKMLCITLWHKQS